MADFDEARSAVCDPIVQDVVRRMLAVPSLTCQEAMGMVEAVAGTIIEPCKPIDFDVVVDIMAKNLKERYAEYQAQGTKH